ncbi:MAG: hypothetical protein K2G38_03720 [Clostridia bacterium]|nr:hypothetical protein [Clostridia bacterium]
MIKLVVSLEYGCFPVWRYTESEEIIDNCLPDELCEDKELLAIFLKIDRVFHSIYVNNKKEFYCKGFSSNKKEEKFRKLLRKAVKMLEERCGDKYEVINRLGYYS